MTKMRQRSDEILQGMRRRNDPISKKAGFRIMREVLRGIYYRHEFARRNSSCSDASKAMLQQFGFDDPPHLQFIHDGKIACLTDELIKRTMKGAGHHSRQLRRNLADFLSDYHVIPVASDGSPGRTIRPFFPDIVLSDKAEGADQLYAVWDALLRFEAFALAILEIPSPVFFPVMLLGEVDSPVGTFRIHTHLDFRNIEYPLFVDFNVPMETIANYLRAISLTEQFTPTVGKKGAIAPKKVPRCRWDDYEKYLKAFDSDKATPRGDKTSAGITLVENWTDKQASDEKQLTLPRRTYSRWLKNGKSFVKAYHTII